MKILFVATVQSHICQFHLPIMDMLQKNGYEVHGVSFDDNTFRVVVKVNSYEDEIVTDASKKNELMFDIQEESIYFNSAMTLSFVIS